MPAPLSSFKQYESQLLARFIWIAATTVGIACVLFSLWSFASQTEQVEQIALAEARALNLQLQALETYVDDMHAATSVASSQGDGFRTAYGATFSNSASQRLSELSGGHTVHIVSNDPRAPYDTPDAFEASVLNLFETTGQTEYYKIDSSNGVPVLRYLSRLSLQSAPLLAADTGEIPVVMGARSIIVPVSSYVTIAMRRTVFTVGFFIALVAVVAGILHWSLRRRVLKPMEQTGLMLEEDAAAKADFLALMSHELRTPLASIIAFTDIWEESAHERNEQERYLVQAIRKNSDTLLHMVNNVIDMAKVDAGKYELHPEEVDLLDVIGAVQAVAEPLALQQGVRLELSFDPQTPIITSDWEALRKILMNLVGNALRFTGSEGSVTISTSWDAPTKTVVVSVTDTGCGISEEDRERIFERFEQAGSVYATKDKGSGLGLSLALGLAQMLGGSLTVSSEVGVGSTFYLRVPASPQPTPKEIATS